MTHIGIGLDFEMGIRQNEQKTVFYFLFCTIDSKFEPSVVCVNLKLGCGSRN